jgi:hypothetical protein
MKILFHGSQRVKFFQELFMRKKMIKAIEEDILKERLT